MSNSNSDRSIGQLFASIMEDISSLIRGEIALAKAEVRKSAQMAARGAGLIGGHPVLYLLARCPLVRHCQCAQRTSVGRIPHRCVTAATHHRHHGLLRQATL